mmetsp:Transcript_510/g.1085  ORF Transcript_510/g.1085 Transcript_510/m.1085 type:complete len:224 (+) Transcript_510:38-709(+)
MTMHCKRGRGVVNLCVFCVFVSCVPCCSAMFFKLKQGQQRCFIEVFRKHEVVVVHYRSPDQNDLPREPEKIPYHVGPKLVVKESTGKAIFDGRTESSGRFAFTARQDIEHSLCWSLEGHSLGQEFRVHLEIQQGIEAENVNDIAKVEHLGAMELKVRKLGDDIKRIKKEQNYMRQREIRFKATVDSTNFRSQWCSVVQILAMFLVTALHLCYLAHFFVKKKIV